MVDANTNAFQHEGATFGATYKYHIVAEMASGLDIFQRLDPRIQLPWSPEFHVVAPGFCFDRDGQYHCRPRPELERHTRLYPATQRSSEAEFVDIETQAGGRHDPTYTDYTAKTNESSDSYRVRVENFAAIGRYVEHSGDGVLRESLITAQKHPPLDARGIRATAGYRIYRKYNLATPRSY